jgi:hypothetical protein
MADHALFLQFAVIARRSERIPGGNQVMSVKKILCAGFLLAACGVGASASAQEVYVKGGFLGAGVGVGYGINDRFGIRADLSTIGSIHSNRSSGQLNYDASLKANQAGAYADWFPFGNGFRLSAGLNVRKLSLDGNAVADSSGNITINNTRVPYGPGDHLSATVKFPDTAPYLGLGWGHHSVQKGWGFVFDVGASFGKPKTSINVSDALYNELDIAAHLNGSTADREIEQQRAKIADSADDFKIFPQVYVGVSYTF